MSQIYIHGIFADNGCIRFVDCAKNLGVWLEDNLSFKTHITKVASSCFKVIRDISKIKSFLTRDSLKTLVTSLILTKLDYCNVLYYKIGTNEINILQTVQNSAIRLVYGRFKYDRSSISHLFNEIHWLKIKERIVFKLCLIVQKCIWTYAPKYLQYLIVISKARTFKLVERKFSSIYGERAFSRASLKVWNNLSFHVRMEADTSEFKKLLKSYLMTDFHNFQCHINTH